MAKIKKKGQAGQAKNYITRTQAVKKLQLSLADFRKLCIWKGIYPREPRNRKKVSKSATASTTFYYAKDIQYLLHEPLLKKFREQKVLEKKITRALGRGDVSDAKRLEQNASRPEKTGRPRYTLDHVVRERYPTFIDAVRDLDDCLSMLFLFANLPSTSSVPPKMIARCERLCHEFQHYLIVSHSLRKSFLSIKGIYYQANIQGEDVLWVVPYKFNQRVVGDVDFRIMGTFVEFYMTMLGFVNYRLYSSIGLKYPPRFDQAKDEQAAELAAFTLEGGDDAVSDGVKPITNGMAELEAGDKTDPKVQEEVNQVIEQIKTAENGTASNGMELVAADPSADAEEAAPTTTLDRFEPTLAGGDSLPQPSYSTNDPSRLFSKCVFFLSRETPRQPLEFILRAFGCRRIGWDAVLGDGAFTTNELDPSITHQIVDRPPVQVIVDPENDAEDNQSSQRLWPNRRVPGRIYVQPQWVWDSINDEELKSPDLYAPGAQLPPHLSPFVKPTHGQYDPTLPLEDQQTEGEALASDSDSEGMKVDEEDEEGQQVENGVESSEPNGADAAKDESDDEEPANGRDSDDNDSFGGFSDEDVAKKDARGPADDEDTDDDEEEIQDQRELMAEAGRKPVKPRNQDPKAKARAALAKKAAQEAEELERAKGMMSKKKRKLFEQMMYSNEKRSAEDERLRANRRKIEKQKAKKARIRY